MTNPLLFTPLTLRGLTLKNRIVVSPMCQYLAVDGYVQDWHHQHHARFALAGYGLAFVEATGVTRDGGSPTAATGIWDDGQIDGLKRIVDGYKAHGVATAIQIGHRDGAAAVRARGDGAAPKRRRVTEPAWQAVGPSALPERDGYPVPHELTEAEINELVDAFVAATERCLAAGFDIVEIHGATASHPFVLLAGLQSPDRSVRRRSRQPHAVSLMVAEAVRAAWPEDRPLFYRASSVDNVPGLTAHRRHGRVGSGIENEGRRRNRLPRPAAWAARRRWRHETETGLSGALCRCRSERSGYATMGGRVDHGAGNTPRRSFRRAGRISSRLPAKPWPIRTGPITPPARSACRGRMTCCRPTTPSIWNAVQQFWRTRNLYRI